MIDSLNTPPLSTLLSDLFAESQKSDARWAQMTQSERAALLAATEGDYRALYAHAKDMFLAVSPETGKLLYMLARATRARAIVEFGTSFGISTLHLAAALKDNGGGRVIGTEFEPAKAARARQNLAAANLDAFAEVREGDAIQSLARDLPAEIDLVLLDGAKVLYPQILGLLEPRLRAGALVVADNAAQSPEYLACVRGEGPYLSVPFGGDVEVSQWLGGGDARR
jgi:predicted O-methyltransferase YrrM